MRSGPMGPFREITALIQGTPTADFHGGENAARLFIVQIYTNVFANVFLNRLPSK